MDPDQVVPGGKSGGRTVDVDEDRPEPTTQTIPDHRRTNRSGDRVGDTCSGTGRTCGPKADPQRSAPDGTSITT